MLQKLSAQAPASVVMIPPHQFSPNPATAADNAFQTDDTGGTRAAIAAVAYCEVTPPYNN